MKATIDLPEDLYRRVKGKSALEGVTVREVAITLFHRWVEEQEGVRAHAATGTADRPIPAWFGAARKYARRTKSHDMEAVRRSIVRGRNGETP